MTTKKKENNYDLWLDGSNKTLFVQQGEKIKVVQLHPGSFEIDRSATNDGVGFFAVSFYGAYPVNNIIEVDSEKDALRALLRVKKTLKSGNGRRVREWGALAALAAVLMVGTTFTAIYASNLGSSQRISVPAPVTAEEHLVMSQQVQSPVVEVPVQPEVPPAPPAPPGWIDPTSLPVATKWSYGNPQGTPLYIFSDPQCSYCKKLEQVLNEFKGEYLLHVYPTPRLGSDSAALIAQFACDPDPRKAWSEWMGANKLNNTVEVRQDCASAAIAAGDVNKNFMDGHNLQSVPVMIRQDGAVHIGGLDKANLKLWLESKDVTKEAKSSCD